MHPIYKKTVRTLLSNVLSKWTCDEPPMLKVPPFPKYPCVSTLTSCGFLSTPLTAKYWIVAATGAKGKSSPFKTHIMATLNVTPDSFSDGSLHNTTSSASEYVTTSVESGADIINVGRYSTRLHAEFCVRGRRD